MPESEPQRQVRQLGDTQIAIAATLTRPDGTAVDVSSLTTKFVMYNAQTGTAKVEETDSNVVETDDVNGEVQYSPQDADVDAVGTYHAYFITESATGQQEHFPAESGHFEIVIMASAP